MVKMVVLHAVSYIRKSLRLENTRGSLQSGMPGSNSETREGSVMVWAAVSWCSILLVPLLPLHGRITAREYMDRVSDQVHPMFRYYFRTTIQFSKTMASSTQLELFSHGLKSMMVT
jgi:hypothetical protein